eukprot:NODE_34_length_31639_cov_0.254375.p15 type:complete len:181 gc:universal NODE_34_length_31639_cov_0.254375:172-714(+)
MISKTSLTQSNSPFWPNEGWLTRELPQEEGVSDACYDAASTFISCTLDEDLPVNASTTAYTGLCKSCSDQYKLFASSCKDDDYKNGSPIMLSSYLACHKEDDKWCASTILDKFECDSCGKYVAQKYVDTNNTGIIRESNITAVTDCNSKANSDNKTALNKQQSGSKSLFNIVGLTILTFY